MYKMYNNMYNVFHFRAAGTSQESPTKSILKELSVQPKTMPHTKLLLKKTLSRRRKWITTEAEAGEKNTKCILQKYPHLNNGSVKLTPPSAALSLKLRQELVPGAYI